MSAHEQEDIDENVHDHENDGGKQPEEDQCPLSDNVGTPETRTIVFYDNWNTTSPMKMFNCERCNHSWAYDSNNEPGTCIKCESDFRIDDSSGVNTSIITSPSTEYHRIQGSAQHLNITAVFKLMLFVNIYQTQNPA